MSCLVPDYGGSGCTNCWIPDVFEINADPTGQTAGSKFVVDGTHQFSDLDELIVNHVQAMARKVDELTNHEKFKPGTEDDLREWTVRVSVAAQY